MSSKTKYIIAGLIILTTLSLIVFDNYQDIVEFVVPPQHRDYDIADDEWVVYHYDEPREGDIYAWFDRAKYHDSIGNRDSSLQCYSKILKHRDSYNEKQFEKLFSCTNGYQEYKLEKLWKYSIAYEKTGQMDSAFAVLKSGMVYNEIYERNDISRRFFQLAEQLYGPEKVKSEFRNASRTLHETTCYTCVDSAFFFFGAEVPSYAAD